MLGTRTLFAGFCAAGLTAAGCATTPAPEPRSATASVMLRHFDNARALNTAAIFGRVGEGEIAAHALGSEGPLPSMPSGSEPYYRAFERSVAEVGGVDDRRGLAQGAATVALRCGDCHLASGLGPSFTVDSPNEATSLRDHMKVHAWASDRMWEGLVGGSDLAWRAGARALSGQSMREQLYASRVSDLQAAARLTANVQNVGVRALSVSGREERARLLGELWGTCSGCHELAGVR